MGHYLLAATPMPGHADPVIAVAAGLVQRGHRVTMLCGRLFERAVERSGAAFVPLSADVDIDYRDIDNRFPERAAIAPGAAQMLWGVRHLFADSIPSQARALRDVMSAGPVDAVLTDMMFLGTLPLLLAGRTGRPPIAHLGISTLALSAPEVAFFGAGLPPARTDVQRARNAAVNRFMQEQVFGSMQRYVNGVLASCGVPALPDFLTDAVVTLPDAYLQIGSPAVEYPRSNLPSHVRFIGVPESPAAVGNAPDWWPELERSRADGRPVMLVTQGTIASADLGQLILPAVTAMHSLDGLLIAITSGADPAPLQRSAPGNVRFAPFIPYAQVLPHIDLLITNGGFGGVLTALKHGVPLIVAGESEEKPEIAARIAHAGVGIDLATGRPTPGLIAAAVGDVLGNPVYRRRAREVAREIRALDATALIEATLRQLSQPAAA